MKVKTDHGTFEVRDITFKARRDLHKLEVKPVTKEGEINTEKFFDVLDWVLNFSFTDPEKILLSPTVFDIDVVLIILSKS